MNKNNGMHYVGPCIRPPGEANSILLQVTVGCSHNKCTFCGSYKEKRFFIKDNSIIRNDILFASEYLRKQDRVFLMDGDALIIPQKKIAWILDQIGVHLPWVKRIGTYGNAKSVRMKTLEELTALKEKGLGIVYLGVESGDDRILKEVNKGVNAESLVKMGKKVREAGIKLYVTVLLGIAGRQRSLQHAKATGELLSAMDPNYVGALTVMLIPGTPLYERYEAGKFQLLKETELLIELREMMLHTHLSRGLFFSNHASNYLPLRARLPKRKQEALDLIDSALKGEIALRHDWMRGL